MVLRQVGEDWLIVKEGREPGVFEWTCGSTEEGGKGIKVCPRKMCVFL